MPPSGAPLVICAKGVEAGTLCLPLEVVEQLCPTTPAAILTGPNFAHEIAAGLPAAGVVAAGEAALRTEVIARIARNREPVALTMDDILAARDEGRR